jgi:hypothetical protein
VLEPTRNFMTGDERKRSGVGCTRTIVQVASAYAGGLNAHECFEHSGTLDGCVAVGERLANPEELDGFHARSISRFG